MAEYIERSLLGIGKAKEEVFENPDYARGWNAAISIIESAPIADVAPVRHGIYEKGCCTCCGYPMATDCWGGGFEDNNYCYNCGAKMDEEG